MGLISITNPIDGEGIDAADVSTPFNTLKNEFNGNIDNDNIKAAAGIVGTKLANTTVAYGKIDPLNKVSVTRGSTQLIGNDSLTAMSWTSEAYDVGGLWVVGDPTKLTIVTTGKYLITSFVEFDVDADGYRESVIKVNGTAVRYQIVPAVAGGVQTTALTTCATLSLTAADYVELFVKHTAGANLNIVAGAYFDATLLA